MAHAKGHVGQHTWRAKYFVIWQSLELVKHALPTGKRASMRDFDKLCLTPIRPLTGEQIRALRERERASQTVFAAYLNVSKGLVREWERDEKQPAGPALKLLALVARRGLSAIA